MAAKTAEEEEEICFKQTDSGCVVLLGCGPEEDEILIHENIDY